MSDNYNLRNRKTSKLDDDFEECGVENCQNTIGTQLCIPCGKCFCPLHMPTVKYFRDCRVKVCIVNFILSTTEAQRLFPFQMNHDHQLRNSKKRCEVEECRKKLDLTSFPCHCGGYFCALHMPAERHNCVYDYKEDARQKLEKNLVKCVKPKVRKF